MIAEKTFGFDVISSGALICQVSKFGRFVAENMSEWLLLWVCVNRLAAITCAQWRRIFQLASDVRINVAAIVACLLLSCVLDAHVFWTFAIRERKTHQVLQRGLDVPKLAELPDTNRSNVNVSSSLQTRPSCSALEAARSGMVETLLVGWFTSMIPICLVLVCTLLLVWRLAAIALKQRTLHVATRVANGGGQHIRAPHKGIPKGVRLAIVITFFTSGDVLIDGINL